MKRRLAVVGLALLALAGCASRHPAEATWRVISRNADGSVTYYDGCNTKTCKGQVCGTTLLHCEGMRP